MLALQFLSSLRFQSGNSKTRAKQKEVIHMIKYKKYHMVLVGAERLHS